MDWFSFIAKHYNEGRYTKQDVAVFVNGNKITDEQYEQITGYIFVDIEK